MASKKYNCGFPLFILDYEIIALNTKQKQPRRGVLVICGQPGLVMPKADPPMAETQMEADGSICLEFAWLT
ncbi:MAG: hypothetical protein A3G52_01000 [Candidatus Taylorbacteria bacterium RIFCSPLOWO2_12_FULL_43_20]|nr:MAG: hypothetical protein A3G52_01000 [Candidatus Taylorbacteria bacterium RIFCSPLOWO2_12_FULL_43_20]